MPLLYSHTQRSLAALCALSLALGLVACDSDDDDTETTEQETAEIGDRHFDHSSLMESYGSEFSADTEAMLSLASFEHLYDALDEIEADAFVTAMGPEIEEAIGLNLLERSSLDATGIDGNAHYFMGDVSDSTVFCTIADDEDVFDEFVVNNIAVAIYDQDSDARDSDEIAGHSVQHVADAVAWVHRDEDSCVLTPHTGTEGVEILEQMEAFLAPGDTPRMTDNDAFNDYLDSDAIEGLIAFYADEEILFSEFLGAAQPQLTGMVDSMVNSQGVRVAIDDGALSVRSWTNAEGEEAQMMETLLNGDADINWAPFASDDLGAALRLSLHGPTLMELIEGALENFMADMAAGFMETLPEDVRGDVDGDEDALFSEEMHSLLSGNAAIFFYDLDNPAQAMEAPDGLLHAEALLAIQLGDADMVHGWIEEFEPALADFGAEFRALSTDDGDHDDIQVITGADVPAWIGLSDDLLIVAPQGLSEAQFASLVDDVDAGPAIADSKLGSALLDDNFNGLYLGSGLWQTVGQMPDAEIVERYLDESRLSLEAVDSSLYIDVDVYPAGGFLNLLAEME